MTRVSRAEIRRLADLGDLAAKAVAREAVDLPIEARQAAVADAGRQFTAATRQLSPADKDRLDLEMLQRTVMSLIGTVEKLSKREREGALLFDPDVNDGAPLRWAGIWDASTEYRPGTVVADKDALWIAERTQTATRPGKGAATGWRRILKRPDRRPRAADR